MQFSKENLTKLSELARISIKKGTEDKMLSDMQAILQYVSEINNVEGTVDGRDITAKQSGHYNVVREDVVTNASGSATEMILNEAPLTEDGQIKVAQVLK